MKYTVFTIVSRVMDTIQCMNHRKMILFINKFVILCIDFFYFFPSFQRHKNSSANIPYSLFYLYYGRYTATSICHPTAIKSNIIRDSYHNVRAVSYGADACSCAHNLNEILLCVFGFKYFNGWNMKMINWVKNFLVC